VALAVANAMAPCVLWMDEIEKGVAADAGGDSDGGVSRRVLGTLLTWMSERTSRVFLVATAIAIARLPPELLRKGRFDEIFFVQLARATEGFSGAEIEQAILAALYEAHAAQKPLQGADIAEELRRTRPLSVIMAEGVAALRDWTRERAVPAD
jgi:SpoVK/Ycf46/Vps4 family AAA+-type ATPase